MKILVLSDSHGNVDNMARCVEMVAPRHILHLGDCIRDAEALQDLFPHIPMTAVPGNCDWGRTEPGEVLCELGGKRILMMHGHTRSVKHTTMNARYARGLNFNSGGVNPQNVNDRYLGFALRPVQ